MSLRRGIFRISRHDRSERTIQLRSRLFTAFTPETVGFALVNGMAIVGPLFPTHIEFLCQESVLCQLQSCFRRELSIVPPAVSHDFLVTRQAGNELI